MNATQALFTAIALVATSAGLVWVLGPLRETRPRTAHVGAIAAPLLAVAAYFALGTPKALDTRSDMAVHAAGAVDLEDRVRRLEARLQAQPDDLESWFLLARSQQVLERWEAAAAAYRRALALAPASADLLADLADTLGVVAGSNLEGEPRLLLERALQAEPAHPKTLLLLAAADFQVGRFGSAQTHWQTLLANTPADSQAAGTARAGLAKLREVADLQPHLKPTTTARGPASKPARQAPPDRDRKPAAARTTASESGP